MKTNDLIVLLAQDTEVRSDLDHMLQQATIAAVFIAAISFFGLIGVRPDIDTAIKTGRFLFKFVITITLTLSAGGVIFRIGKPGASLGASVLMLFAPLALAVGAALFELFLVPSQTWVGRMIGHNSRLCLTIIPLLSCGPLACFIVALRHSAPARPGLAGATAGLMSAGIAASFYAANCNDDSPLFVLLWYPIAIGVVVTASAFIGRRLLRW
ncbi:NrsF family protein [Rhizobium sp. 60-20]|jgi:hypothetical protein|uniref:NrsF family protein n=1 Tax=Rhizobium sp. 60-20 TaxID=1895819 RepID=UPI0009266B46|nr:NrsF family protein [Rhizobium sp. 60-20]MBN8954776.1 DUF1109 family protein [Rhizobium tropici]OJY72025.1 MAG: hypothetical protein BGP09_25050 [Rhizobium sp. 60-20]